MKLKFIIPVILFIIFMSSDVKAIDFEPEGEGETTYNIDLVSWFTGGPNAEECLGDIGKGSITLKGYYLCGYKNYYTNSCNVELILYNKNGKYNTGQFLQNITHMLPSSNYKYSYKNTRGYFNYKTLVFDDGYNPSTDFYGELYWKGISDYAATNNNGEFDTNIPIFSSKELAEGYINGTVDITESTNWSDIAPIVYGDIEVPQNIQVDIPDNSFFEFNYDINITWTQNDENYINWDTEILFYASFKYRFSILGISFAEWEHYDDKLLWNDLIKCRRLKYTITDSKIMEAKSNWIDNNTEHVGSCTTDDKNYSIYIRNKYFDGTKTHYSNWVKIYVNSPQDGLFELEGEYNSSLEEIQYNDKLGDFNKDFTQEMPSGSVNPDSSYDGSLVDDSSKNSAGSFVSYISDGFGLLGDSGLIACVSSALSFVPDFVWVIIGAGISLLVIIAIAKFVF